MQIAKSYPYVPQTWATPVRANAVALAVFYIGLALIPFDNLRFAPSRGWATVSPYFFLLSALMFFLGQPSVFIRLVKNRKSTTLLAATALFLLSLVAYLFANIHFSSLAFSYIKLALGFSFLVSLYYVGLRNPLWTVKAAKILLASYSVAFIAGLNQWLKLHGLVPYLIPYERLFERFYPDRVQYTFTEPSFTSLHAIGVLMFVGLMLPRQEIQLRKILWSLAACFIALTAISGSSLRMLLDVALIGSLFFFATPFKKKWKIVLLLAAAIAAFLSFAPERILNRLEKVVAIDGIKDTSGQIRKFRIDAALGGLSINPESMLIGYGFGNAGAAIMDGYNVALTKIDREYEALRALQDNPDGVYSLPVKIVVEHGVLGTFLLLIWLYAKRHRYLLLFTVLIYMQFDSYAFYSLWLYAYCRIFDICNDFEFKQVLQLKSVQQ